MSNIDTLSHCRLFDKLTNEELAQLAPLFKLHHFRKGDYVCREGAWGDSMYVVDTGEIKVTKKLDVDNNWEITTLGIGEFFGEVSLIDGSPRTAACYAVVNTSLLELTGRDFMGMISKGDAISLKLLEALLRVLINRVRATDDVVARIMRESGGVRKPEGSMHDNLKRMMIG